MLTVVPYSGDDEEAVRLANDSIYGLGGGVVSTSESRAFNVARRIRAGLVTAQKVGGDTVADLGPGAGQGPGWGADPKGIGQSGAFGGFKQSGIGREWGHHGWTSSPRSRTWCGADHPTDRIRKTRRGTMAGRLEGKRHPHHRRARGQGRAHAVRMAAEGADIIAVDVSAQIESNKYPLSSPEDLAETEPAVKELGRRIVARQADVRERSSWREALEAGLDRSRTTRHRGRQRGHSPHGHGDRMRRTSSTPPTSTSLV